MMGGGAEKGEGEAQGVVYLWLGGGVKKKGRGPGLGGKKRCHLLPAFVQRERGHLR